MTVFLYTPGPSIKIVRQTRKTAFSLTLQIQLYAANPFRYKCVPYLSCLRFRPTHQKIENFIANSRNQFFFRYSFFTLFLRMCLFFYAVYSFNAKKTLKT